MNLSHLKYFYDTARLGSLKKASRENSVSPGAISQAILKLEQSFGVRLLHHSKNSLLLTEQGKLLLELCPPTLSSVENLLKTMQETVNPFSGKIYFGTQQSIATSLLPPVLVKFNNTYPGLKIDFTLGLTAYIKTLLDKNALDFAISLNNVDYEKHHKETLLEGEFVLISKHKIKPKSGEAFLLTGDTPETESFINQYKKKHSAAPSIKMRIDSWGVIKRLALSGFGVGLLPDYLLTSSEKKHIVERYKLPSIKYSISCVYTHGTSLNKKSQMFLRALKESLEKKG